MYFRNFIWNFLLKLHWFWIEDLNIFRLWFCYKTPDTNMFFHGFECVSGSVFVMKWQNPFQLTWKPVFYHLSPWKKSQETNETWIIFQNRKKKTRKEIFWNWNIPSNLFPISSHFLAKKNEMEKLTNGLIFKYKKFHAKSEVCSFTMLLIKSFFFLLPSNIADEKCC